MTSVWVVEQGYYSDYRVVGVFSSREQAETVATWLNAKPSDPAEVSEWPLDPGVAEINSGLTFFELLMNQDGDTKDTKPSTYRDYRTTASGFNSYSCLPWKSGRFWGRDAEHAIKVASEHRARLIASGEWK